MTERLSSWQVKLTLCEYAANLLVTKHRATGLLALRRLAWIAGALTAREGAPAESALVDLAAEQTHEFGGILDIPGAFQQGFLAGLAQADTAADREMPSLRRGYSLAPGVGVWVVRVQGRVVGLISGNDELEAKRSAFFRFLLWKDDLVDALLGREGIVADAFDVVPVL